jgi:hypothetical protein
MRLTFFALPFLLALGCFPAGATTPSKVSSASSSLQIDEARRNEVRDAVLAHRAAQREEARREELAAGRRLTPAELFELRQQVREQWLPQHAEASLNSAESLHGEQIAPVSIPDTSALTAPRSQRR